MTTQTLAYTPFLQPVSLPGMWWWLTLVPLAFGIAAVYKAVRTRNADAYWRLTVTMAAQIVGAMVAMAIGLHALLRFGPALLG